MREEQYGECRFGNDATIRGIEVNITSSAFLSSPGRTKTNGIRRSAPAKPQLNPRTHPLLEECPRDSSGQLLPRSVLSGRDLMRLADRAADRHQSAPWRRHERKNLPATYPMHASLFPVRLLIRIRRKTGSKSEALSSAIGRFPIRQESIALKKSRIFRSGMETEIGFTRCCEPLPCHGLIESVGRLACLREPLLFAVSLVQFRWLGAYGLNRAGHVRPSNSRRDKRRGRFFLFAIQTVFQRNHLLPVGQSPATCPRCQAARISQVFLSGFLFRIAVSVSGIRGHNFFSQGTDLPPLLPHIAPGCQRAKSRSTLDSRRHKLFNSYIFLTGLEHLGRRIGSATGNRTRVLRLRISRPNP